VHYLNQFFGGIGGEQHADQAPLVREGPVGPGIGLQKELGDNAQVVATLICGDNYFSNNTADTLAFIIDESKSFKPDVIVAGPAFNAGRYGFACGEVAKAATEILGIPAVTAMYHENPAAETYRKVKGVWILPTGQLASEMGKVLPRLAAFALKQARGEPIGPAQEEGYIPTGLRKLEFGPRAGADRALDMLLDKLAGRPFKTEIAIDRFEQVAPASPIGRLETARVAVITTSGLVPKGNPDGFKMFNATEWATYRLPDAPALKGEDWEVIHGGYNTAYAQANPNLVLPLDALRQMAGKSFGELYSTFYSITGVGTSLAVARRAGQEIAASMREAQIDAALLVAT
jgi:glycine reductase